MVDALSRSVGLIATLDPRAVVLLVLLCAIGEIAFGVPYVMETVWLLAGYYIGAHTISIWGMLVLWLAVISGRTAGAVALYYVAMLGTGTAARLESKMRLSRLIPRSVRHSSVLDKVSQPTAISVAFGRLIGLRVPVAVVCAGRRKLKPLLMGVLLSSIAWDGVYVSAGAIVGTRASLKPVEMLVASLVGVTLVYVIAFGMRRLVKHLRPATGVTRSTEP